MLSTLSPGKTIAHRFSAGIIYFKMIESRRDERRLSSRNGTRRNWFRGPTAEAVGYSQSFHFFGSFCFSFSTGSNRSASFSTRART